MSEIKHKRGTLKLVHLPTGVKTVEQLLRLKLQDDGDPYPEGRHSYPAFLPYMSLEDWFLERFHGQYYLIKGDLWEVDNIENIDHYNDLFRAVGIDDETIEFEVKYHNGGCGEVEAVGYALENLKNDGI